MIVNKYQGNGGGSGSGYTLPTATSSRLGGVKIGDGIAVENDGTISVSGGSADLSAYWTSAETKSYVDAEVSGVTPDMSAYWTSGETKSYVDDEISGVTEDLSGLDERVTDIEDTMAKSYRIELSTPNPDDFTARDIDNLNDFFAAVSGDTSLADGAYLYVDGDVFRLYNRIINGDAGEFGFGYSDGEYLQSVQLIFGLGEYEEGNYFDNDLVGKEQINTIDEVVSMALNDLNDRKVNGDGISNIVSISQSDYDNLSEYDPSTLYVIINNNNNQL